MCPTGYHNGYMANQAFDAWCPVATLFIMCQCMSCSEAIDVITGSSHCFHDCIYIIYACIVPVRFEQCVSWITYDHWCNIYIHGQVWEQITWYRCETLHVIFPCLALGAWSIPQSTELRRTFECDPYWLRLLNCTAII